MVGRVMKINLTETQWRDIQICLLTGISNSREKNKKIDLYSALNKRLLKTHDQIAEARKKVKVS